MPVNYQQIRASIKAAGQLAPIREREVQSRRDRVFQLLDRYAHDLPALLERVQSTLAHIPDFRCALPGDQPINIDLPETKSPAQVILWAADGSQIIPDSHLAVQFGVINVGLIRLAKGEPPRQSIESQLLYADDLFTSQGYLIGEELIALRRDYQERAALLSSAKIESIPVLTLTDGPIELFREGKESREYQEKLAQYISILSQMAELQVLTAGYVDKPRSDLVVRLLELQILSNEQLSKADQIHSFQGVYDAEIFAQLLKPGERSATFGLQSRAVKQFHGLLAIHFMYLNVGREGKPQIVRVEFPAWVAQSTESIQIIQHKLLEQCRQMGSKSYPYILHRAHETALVTYEERNRLLELIQMEMESQNIHTGETSNKQQAKNLPGKTRFGQ
ncbi:MAG: DNA double-strand break repair nuclease NurA [Anaerolineaceae bacterium]|nr:DNA double-strand break repair nuclease NurA [Anaerolineaceae bacterium]